MTVNCDLDRESARLNYGLCTSSYKSYILTKENASMYVLSYFNSDFYVSKIYELGIFHANRTT